MITNTEQEISRKHLLEGMCSDFSLVFYTVYCSQGDVGVQISGNSRAK